MAHTFLLLVFLLWFLQVHPLLPVGLGSSTVLHVRQQVGAMAPTCTLHVLHVLLLDLCII
jgi:hypothetical protein